MNYTDDGYAAMLLTMALSPNREEYARPFSTDEYRNIEASVRHSHYGALGKLLNADVSGLMMYLNLSESEALRAYTLLHRSVPLTYALESLGREGIEVATEFDNSYPQRLNRMPGGQAPAFFYWCGDPSLLSRPAVAIVGIGGVRTDDDVRGAVSKLVAGAVEHGYAIITGGEPGVSRVAAGMTDACGGILIDILGGDMRRHIHADGVAERIATGRGAVISLVHPDAMFTVVHAAARNKLLFGLSEAAFIFNTDGRRGEQGIVQNRYCRNVYAWEGCEANRTLIQHGATAFGPRSPLDFEEMVQRWKAGNAEQLSMFDLL